MLNLRSIKKSPIEEDLRQYRPLLPAIEDLYRQYQGYTDLQLQQLSRGLRAEAADHESLNTLMPYAYALVKEVCHRQFGLLAYEEQMIAAIALHHGKLIEMQTGEGKTMTALFPAYLNALLGKGVHILTFNDYLARRDACWSRSLFSFLGLSVGFLQQGMPPEQKRKAYQADILYATAKEVGFDYLRSFIAYGRKELVQRPFFFALADEADALMIDEARNPLVLAGKIEDSRIDAIGMAQLAALMEQGVHFEINDYSRNVFLTEAGLGWLETRLNKENLIADEHCDLLSAIHLALHARTLLKRDVDYIVRDREVLLVDEFTGRIVPDRKWRNGLQTAVEAKEGLPIRSEGRILNSISLQHFLYRYPKLSGMTATARQAAEEFENFYGLKTVIIPPHRQVCRTDEPDEIFAGVAEKTAAVVSEVEKAHGRGQPVLIGTLTVKESEELAAALEARGVPSQVLNAKNDAAEALIIAEAGRSGRVTISTNMAGRGTDILPGGGDPEERSKVLALGGLYVIGTNRHESSRIDRQLRGRAGRQGDVGLTRFFISLEDELMLKYQLREALPGKYQNLGGPEPVKEGGILKFIDHIQRVIEGQTYDMRRTLLLYSDLIEKQRLIIQSERQAILLDDDLLLERAGLSPEQKPEESTLERIRSMALFQYDKYWSEHLDRLQQLKEGIYLVRFGGQKPLREFQRKSDEWFRALCRRIDDELEAGVLTILSGTGQDASSPVGQRPSSTWTYIINDNPFGNQLAITLLDNSNLGLQVDPVSAFLLFFAALFQKYKK